LLTKFTKEITVNLDKLSGESEESCAEFSKKAEIFLKAWEEMQVMMPVSATKILKSP